jgi:hypothetical protein
MATLNPAAMNSKRVTGGVARIRLRCTQNITASKLAEIINCKMDLFFMECFEMKGSAKGNFIARCTTEESEKLHSSAMKPKLKKEGIEIVVTPEAKARRTVICRNVPSTITEHDDYDIITEIEEKNKWAKIIHAFVFNNGRNLKLEFAEERAANKALENGIKAYHLIIPHFNIEKDLYIPVLQCRKCYKLGHDTKACKTTLAVCSECGGNHRHEACKASFLKCLLCEESHSAMSNKCPAKREYVKHCRRDLQQQKKHLNLQNKVKSGISYADMAKSPSTSTTQKPITINTPYLLGIDESTKQTQAMICILLAHLSSNGDATSFQQKLDEALTTNDLPTIKITPNLLPASNTLNLTNKTKTAEKILTAKTPSSPKRKVPSDNRSVAKMQHTSGDQSSEGADGSSEEEEQMEAEEEMEARSTSPREEIPPNPKPSSSNEEKTPISKYITSRPATPSSDAANVSVSSIQSLSTADKQTGQKMDGRLFNLKYKILKKINREEVPNLTHKDYVELYDQGDLELNWDGDKIKEARVMRWFFNDLLKNYHVVIPQASPKKSSPKKKSPKKVKK